MAPEHVRSFAMFDRLHLERLRSCAKLLKHLSHCDSRRDSRPDPRVPPRHAVAKRLCDVSFQYVPAKLTTCDGVHCSL
jgi:hypothetical protein